MNRVLLVGRLTAKPELRYTNSNIPYTRFSVAVDGIPGSNGERRTDFINTVAWRKQAENVCQYLDKGSLVSVEGRLQTSNYTDKDGNKRYTMDVQADNIRFLESRSQSQNRLNNQSATPYDFQQPSNDVNIDVDPFADFGDSVSIDDNFLD
ncbi:MAG TPA: single-stranded DNA-binding protein [Candidatus Faecisoma merdavium]|nr:single-stranded DNA-binding protein [Candidatus Faecisoma merdavium]